MCHLGAEAEALSPFHEGTLPQPSFLPRLAQSGNLLEATLISCARVAVLFPSSSQHRQPWDGGVHGLCIEWKFSLQQWAGCGTNNRNYNIKT